jgi:hypothetical protein
MGYGAHPSRSSAGALLGCVAALVLCAMQCGDRFSLNHMPFAHVQRLVSRLGTGQRLAKQGDVEFRGGQVVSGKLCRSSDTPAGMVRGRELLSQFIAGLPYDTVSRRGSRANRRLSVVVAGGFVQGDGVRSQSIASAFEADMKNEGKTLEERT